MQYNRTIKIINNIFDINELLKKINESDKYIYNEETFNILYLLFNYKKIINNFLK